MRYLYLVIFALALAAVTAAWGGSRAKDSAGALPVLDGGAVTDGVALSEVEGCRLSARVTDGGTINGGTLAVFYYDAVLGWVRASTALDCSLQASKLLDGGAPSAQVCPDLGVLAKFGRIAVAANGLVGADGGAVTATTRVECWGRALP